MRRVVQVGVPLIVMPMQEIQQTELARMVMLRNQLASIRKELRILGEAALLKLERHVAVEAGTNELYIEERRRGSRVTKVLLLNGSELND